MISSKMQEALSSQFQLETESAYIYLGMANYLRSIDMNGCAMWMEVQAKEEMNHAMKIYRAVHEFNGLVTFYDIKQPETQFASIRAVFERALEHERRVTAAITELTSMANSEKDYPTVQLLQWFVNEQVEEENQLRDILHRFTLAGDNNGALFFLDRDLGSRT